MRVTFLGTGTSQGVPMIACTCAVCRSDDPRDARLRVSVLVETCGQKILIDAGPDLRQQFLRAGIVDVDAVLLTHEHMDHISGMDDLRAVSFAHEPPKAVPIYADAPTQRAVRRVFSYAFEASKYPGVPEFDMRLIDRAPFRVGEVHVIPIEVMHLRMPVLGFRIGGFTYITDAKTISAAEKEKIRGTDVLVLNALRPQPHYSHLDLAEALALVAEVRPREAYFTHISHQMGLHAEVRSRLPPGVLLAWDAFQVELPEPIPLVE
ncbi:MAG: MBL fold metallo-hydrolase [Flavobacteriales bacterium]|nr:MBL fold metallo-hydrolase [Flavobacteriales bacterium]